MKRERFYEADEQDIRETWEGDDFELPPAPAHLVAAIRTALELRKAIALKLAAIEINAQSAA